MAIKITSNRTIVKNIKVGTPLPAIKEITLIIPRILVFFNPEYLKYLISNDFDNNSNEGFESPVWKSAPTKYPFNKLFCVNLIAA